MAKPIVAIVGRPNVGKSALFNRIVGERRAIVDAVAGVTRDPLYADAEWDGRVVSWVDTGGIAEGGIDMAEEVREQAEAAIAGADAVVLVTDVKEGLHPLDRQVALLLRRTGKGVVVAANKADNRERMQAAAEFYELGLGEPVAVSAVQGLGIGELLDRVVEMLPADAPEGATEEVAAVTRVAVVGRPNVGKSSLVNAILGHKRLLVSEVPGTTRDAVDCLVTRGGRGERAYLFVDTAGVRQAGRYARGLERYAVMRSLRAIDRSQVAVLVVDATAGAVHQDLRLAAYVHEAGRALVVALNKWDLVSKEDSESRLKQVAARLGFVSYAPVRTVSARTGRGMGRLLETLDSCAEAHRRRVSDSALNRWLEDACGRTPPPGRVGVGPIRQVASEPPTFVVLASQRDAVPESYRRYIEAGLREAFDWQGTPFRIIWRERRA